MTKSEKVLLLKGIADKSIEIIEGKIVHNSLIVFTKGTRKYWDNECVEEIADFNKLNKKDLIFIPFNNR